MSARRQQNLKCLFPELNRPEYPPSPDVLLSSLIQPLVSASLSPVDAAELGGKWISYQWLTNRNAGRVHETRPQIESQEDLGAFCTSLSESGLHLDPKGEMTESHARAVLNSIRGISGTNAKSEITVAVSPAMAVLQNGSGVFAKNNPPNYDRIFHQMASLGCGKVVDGGTLGRAALEALKESSTTARVTKVLDDFFRSRASGNGPDVELSTAGQVPAWLEGMQTPFNWFHRNWERLCKGGWIGRMPNRRWCDWASCVLRTAAGMGFLWEASFYVRLGRGLIDDGDPELAEGFVKVSGTPLLSWVPATRRVTERSVNESLRSTIAKGLAVREAIFNDIFDDQDLPGGPDDWLDNPSALLEFINVARAIVRRNDAAAGALRKALAMQAVKGGANNTHETVRYSLIQRRETGREADFYHLLKTVSRRFLVVEPGQEWLVVIASLAAGEAGGRVTLQDVADELGQLGLVPGRQQLTALLEECGLTRSFRDAEQAIEVAAAF